MLHADEHHGAGGGILEVDDRLIFDRFHLKSLAEYMRQSPPGRLKRIMTEIATLKSDLPNGIFAKYASSQPDCMKVVVVGSEDTPYENGVYEFDLFCPQAYPDKPPKMFFWGTENGKTMINPNLEDTGEGKF